MLNQIHHWRVYILFAIVLMGCGARTGLLVPERQDAANSEPVCRPVDDGCGRAEQCGNGSDDNCDGRVDENCDCEPGSVQSCFQGPPGRRNVGVCRDGSQVCSLARRWGTCERAVLPGTLTCVEGDSECTGCSHASRCEISCPAPDDARIAQGVPFQPYPLRGGDFFAGNAVSWRWDIQGGPCDEVAPAHPSFTLRRGTMRDAEWLPRLSGDYRVQLSVTDTNGTEHSCSWYIPVRAPGLRVEMCYPESNRYDLDLFLHKPGSTSDWYRVGSGNAMTPTSDACGWHNCEGHLRGTGGFPPRPVSRADWGYAWTHVSQCENGPYGVEWLALGACANPRLDLDNNLLEGVGYPENINVDHPRNGETFRVMVQNFSGATAHPIVNIYCGGVRKATWGTGDDALDNFQGNPGESGVGAMWRVTDVTVDVNANGETVGCQTPLLHPPGQSAGYDVTREDPRY